VSGAAVDVDTAFMTRSRRPLDENDPLTSSTTLSLLEVSVELPPLVGFGATTTVAPTSEPSGALCAVVVDGVSTPGLSLTIEAPRDVAVECAVAEAVSRSAAARVDVEPVVSGLRFAKFGVVVEISWDVNPADAACTLRQVNDAAGGGFDVALEVTAASRTATAAVSGAIAFSVFEISCGARGLVAVALTPRVRWTAATIPSDLDRAIYAHSNVTLSDVDVSLDELQEVGGNLTLLRTTAISMLGLQRVGLNIDGSATSVSELALPLLETVGGSLTVSSNGSLASLALPLLETVGGGVDFSSNATLTALDFPVLISMGTSVGQNYVVTENPLLPCSEIVSEFCGMTLRDSSPLVANNLEASCTMVCQ